MSHSISIPVGNGVTPVETITGNIGGAVSPTVGGNINLVGAGGVVVTGNPGTNTQTISVSGVVPETFDADSGSAASALGIVNVFGGTGIVTSAAGNTITIAATGTTNLTYKNITSGDSPYTVLTTDDYLSCNVTGGVISILLPSTPVLGKVYIVKDRVGLAVANNITVTTVGGVTLIDAAATFTMNTAYESINIIGNGTTYEVY